MVRQDVAQWNEMLLRRRLAEQEVGAPWPVNGFEGGDDPWVDVVAPRRIPRHLAEGAEIQVCVEGAWYGRAMIWAHGVVLRVAWDDDGELWAHVRVKEGEGTPSSYEWWFKENMTLLPADYGMVSGATSYAGEMERPR